MRTELTQAGRAERRRAFSSTDLLLLGVVLVWGFGYVTFKVGEAEIPVGLFNLIRFLIAVPILWTVLLLSNEDWRLARRHWVKVGIMGVIGMFIYSYIYAVAANITVAANLSLLMALSPIWTILIQWTMGRGRPGRNFLVGSLVAFAGAALVIAFGANRLEFTWQSFRGDFLGVIASVVFAWYGVAAQPLLKEYSGVKLQAWINLIALVGFLCYRGPAALDFSWSGVSLSAWLSVLFVGSMVGAFSHLVWYIGIARVGPDRVMLVMYLIPAFAALSGTIFLGQPLGVVQVTGALIALAGVALVRRNTA
ncbi:MAG TPA: DMT family transporter [Symbiobacteriaceae bacterium]|jgi:drug/metabolite transporter (DMT)-like permease